MARFYHSQLANRLYLESNLYAVVGKALAGMGHGTVPTSSGAVGGFQVILMAQAAGSGCGRRASRASVLSGGF